MAARIFLRDVAGCHAGQILELDWAAFEQSALRHHGVRERVEDYTLPIEDAAQLYVATLHPPTSPDPRVESRSRPRGREHD